VKSLFDDNDGGDGGGNDDDDNDTRHMLRVTDIQGYL
jgi:hypothetical protein